MPSDAAAPASFKLITVLILIIALAVRYRNLWNHSINEPGLISSIWCDASNDTCSVSNLCSYRNQFVLFRHPNQSVFVNFHDRDVSLDLSAVAGHNGHPFDPVVMDSRNFAHFAQDKHFTLDRTNWALVYARFKPDNLMHLLHDEILPLLATTAHLQTFAAQSNPVLIAFDDRYEANRLSINRQLYDELFGQLPTSISTDQNQLKCWSHAYVGLRKESVFYDYGFRQPQHVRSRSDEQKRLIRFLTNWAKNRLLRNAHSSSTESRSRVALVHRNATRKILNSESLIRLIEDKFERLVILIDLDDYDTDEHASIQGLLNQLQSCDVLIGMHGAGLSLSMFLSPASTVVELFPFGISPDLIPAYQYMAEIYGLRYFSWENQQKAKTFGHPKYSPNIGGVSHLDTKQRAAIVSMETELKPFKCCSDPDFLYRIYQDTEVDLNEMEVLLTNVFQAKDSELNRHTIQYVRPATVENLNCQRLPSDTYEALVSWSLPWNHMYFNQTEITFEILIEDVQSKASNVFHSKKTQFHMKLPLFSDSRQSIWVRTVASRIEGKWNQKAIVC